MPTRRLCLLTLVVAATVILVSCGQAQPPASRTAASPPPAGSPGTVPASPTAGNPASLTVEEVYRRVEQTINRPGMLYHATIQDTGATDLWVDGLRNVARRELGRPGETSIMITTAQGRYTLTSYGEIMTTNQPMCEGASVAAAAVLDCPNAAFETYTFATSGAAPQRSVATPSITIHPDQDAGRPAIVLIAHKRQQPWRSGPVTETRRLYLDPDTYLPFAEEVERESQGPGSHSRARLTYTHEFIPAGTVPAGFFDPAALRRARPDPQAALDQPPPGFTLYWLGAQFAGAAGVPPLEMWDVDRYNPAYQRWDSDQIILDYTRADDPFGGQPVVRLTEYARTVWETGQSAALAPPSQTHTPDGPCWTREEIALPNGRAILFLGFNWPDHVPPGPDDGCPTDRPHDRFEAHVFLGETVIVVSPGIWPNQTREGVEALVRALRPREGR